LMFHNILPYSKPSLKLWDISAVAWMDVTVPQCFQSSSEPSKILYIHLPSHQLALLEAGCVAGPEADGCHLTYSTLRISNPCFIMMMYHFSPENENTMFFWNEGI
jgi:hypothetical protein